MARMPVHVFTVNDYLAERDAEKLRPVYQRFGLTLGAVIHGQETPDLRAVYRADVVYGTNKEITFDYLRDQTALGEIGRAHVCTPVTNAHLVCRLQLVQKKIIITHL